MRIGPLGIWELLIILVVVLLIFGPRRLPEMAKGLGQSVREFRKGIRDIKNDFEEGEKGASTSSAQATPTTEPSTQPPTQAATSPQTAQPAAAPTAPDAVAAEVPSPETEKAKAASDS